VLGVNCLRRLGKIDGEVSVVEIECKTIKDSENFEKTDKEIGKQRNEQTVNGLKGNKGGWKVNKVKTFHICLHIRLFFFE
jgi:hypothetical protein